MKLIIRSALQVETSIEVDKPGYISEEGDDRTEGVDWLQLSDDEQREILKQINNSDELSAAAESLFVAGLRIKEACPDQKVEVCKVLGLSEPVEL